VRHAKDNQRVPKHYYRPERSHCPRCRQVLTRAYPWWRKHVVFLSGRALVVSVGYHCTNPHCADAQEGRMHTSPAAERLTLRGSSFALQVIVQIGYWRFWKRWTITQIHESLTLERALPISEREVLYLVGIFLVLLRCTYHLRLAAHDGYFQRHGLFLAIDALKPEKGNRALYVVRDLKFGLVWHQVSLFSANQSTLEKLLLQPLEALGYRIRGVVSDDEKALRLAIAQRWPHVSHQTCQIHCLCDAAAPMVSADQAFKKALKKAVRAPLYAVCRNLNQLAPADPCAPVLSTYADLIRHTLTEGSKPPFDLGGLRVFADLARLEHSLKRNQEKGGIRSWRNCWRWYSAAEPLPLAIANSSANMLGCWSWNDGWIHRTSRVNRLPRRAASKNRSKNSWQSWQRMPYTIPKMPWWSSTSVRFSSNAGRVCSRATPGRNATAPITTWKRSLGACAPASDKFMVASLCMSSSSATASGPSILTPPSPSAKSWTAAHSSTKPTSMLNMLVS